MSIANPAAKAALVAAFAAVLNSGCQTTTDPYTGERKTTSNMPGNVTFRTGSADLNAQFFKVLDGVAQVARKYDKTIIEIAGHTDNVGGADFNRQLSQRRASAVAQYLMSKGVTEPRIMTAAGGEEHPIASNSTEQGRAANRRVEVTLAPLKE